jgi:BMFP domain-containing protein YqiC
MLHTEQAISVRRQVTQKRVTALNLNSEQAISVRRKVTQKRVALLNLNSEQSFTLVTSGTRRLREQLEALAARVEELEKTNP